MSVEKPFLSIYIMTFGTVFYMEQKGKWNTRMRVQLITGVVVENMDFRLCTT